MVAVFAAEALHITYRTQLHIGIAQIAVFRQFKLQIEAAKRGGNGRTFRQHIPLWAIHNVANFADAAGGQRNRPCAADVAQPSFDAYRLAGAIHCPVIEDVPAQFTLYGTPLPALFVPIGGAGGQDGGVCPLAGHQVAGAAVSQIKRGQPIGIGLAGLAAVGGHGYATQRAAVGQIGGPGNQLRMVGKGIEADLGDLHPGLDDLVTALPEISGQRGRLDNGDDVAGAAVEGWSKGNGRFRQHIFYRIYSHHLVHHQLAGRCREVIIFIRLVKVAQIAQVGGPIIRGDGVQLHPNFVIVHHKQRQAGVAGGGIGGNERLTRAADKRRGGIHPEAHGFVVAQRLAKDVG